MARPEDNQERAFLVGIEVRTRGRAKGAVTAQAQAARDAASSAPAAGAEDGSQSPGPGPGQISGPSSGQSSGQSSARSSGKSNTNKPSIPEFDAEESLAELRTLAGSAGAKVVGEILQRRDRPDPATLIGAGKL
jgi:hypothetical protein